MDSVLQQISDWLKELLVTAIMSNLSGTFDSVNDQVRDIAGLVGQTPANFMPGVFNLVKNLTETVVLPIAGIILTFIACYELIQLVVSHNNLANFETWIFFKWIFKTFVAVTLISNTFNITMAVFDVARELILQSGGLISGTPEIDASALAYMQSNLEAMEVAELFAILMESCITKVLLQILAIIIFVIVNGRMIEIYLTVSLAPIPFATFGNKEQSQVGQNYFRGLWALALQGFLMMICVGIYSMLISSVAFNNDIMGSLWRVMGFTVLLAFTLFKTGSIAKSILHAH